MPLRRPQCAVAARNRLVGRRRPRVKAHIGAAVQVQHPLPGAARHAGRRRLIGAGIHHGITVNGGNFALTGYAHPQFDAPAVPGAAGHEFLLPAVLNPHRTAGLPGKQRRQYRQAGFILVAIPAAHIGADDAHPVGIEAQNPRQRRPVHMDAPGGFPHRKPAVRIPRCQSGARLQRRGRVRGQAVGFL